MLCFRASRIFFTRQRTETERKEVIILEWYSVYQIWKSEETGPGLVVSTCPILYPNHRIERTFIYIQSIRHCHHYDFIEKKILLHNSVFWKFWELKCYPFIGKINPSISNDVLKVGSVSRSVNFDPLWQHVRTSSILITVCILTMYWCYLLTLR